MKYYIIAGEASGDLHGSNLITALKNEDPNAQFRAWGGDLMEKAGSHINKHYRELAFMGFIEVAKNIRTIANNFKLCKKDILAFQPDAVIFIDYPGFNLRMAKWAKAKGLKTLYYISPQVWAWNTGRVEKIKTTVDKMFSILPFEKEFFKSKGYEVEYVGHPLLDHLSKYKSRKKIENNGKKLIALLPGSRKQEIETILPTFLKICQKNEELFFALAMAPSQKRTYYEKFVGKTHKVQSSDEEFILQSEKYENLILLKDLTYDLLDQAEAALVTSGTATLETALFKVPQVVVYKSSNVSYQIAKRLVKVNYISLVNLIMDKDVVTELIQHDFNEVACQKELMALFEEEPRRAMLQQYDVLQEKLGGTGASARTAKSMFNFLQKAQV